MLTSSIDDHEVLLMSRLQLIYAPQGVFFILSATAIAINRRELFSYVLTVHVVCWMLQFFGHGVHEKRAPALFDNLVQGTFSPIHCIRTAIEENE